MQSAPYGLFFALPESFLRWNIFIQYRHAVDRSCHHRLYKGGSRAVIKINQDNGSYSTTYLLVYTKIWSRSFGREWQARQITPSCFTCHGRNFKAKLNNQVWSTKGLGYEAWCFLDLLKKAPCQHGYCKQTGTLAQRREQSNIAKSGWLRTQQPSRDLPWCTAWQCGRRKLWPK